jgi:hypothetical protein
MNRAPFIMTSGPAQVREFGRFGRSFETIKTDSDQGFFHFYKKTFSKMHYF